VNPKVTIALAKQQKAMMDKPTDGKLNKIQIW
jgi:hypothetical protein